MAQPASSPLGGKPAVPRILGGEPAVPRILHQLWIGPKPRPEACLASWRNRHTSGWRYVLWDEARLRDEGLYELAAQAGVAGHIAAAREIPGQADLWRLLILLRDGGVFVDADCLCVRPLDELLDGRPGRGAVAYENERCRGPGCFPSMDDIPQDMPLVANGFMAFPPGHAVLRAALAEVVAQDVAAFAARRAWRASGPGLLTRSLRRVPDHGVMILPSYTMYPVHASGLAYEGHGRVYARQLWASTDGRAAESLDGQALDDDGDELPAGAPAVSVLVCSRNTRAVHLRACLDSIMHQVGRFRMQLVWVDDGSDPLHAGILARMLDDVEARTRWTSVRRPKVPAPGAGVAAALNLGLAHCDHDLVARMDADDIMTLDRLQRQLDWMRARPGQVCLGAQAALFRDGAAEPHAQTQHPAVLRRHELAAYSPAHLPRWLANHPTLMFRGGKVRRAGGYRIEYEGVEDYDMLLRLLDAGHEVHNLPEVVLYYRVHPAQATQRINSAHKAAMLDRLAADFVRSARARNGGQDPAGEADADDDEWVRVDE